jgi:hypothetical protein
LSPRGVTKARLEVDDVEGGIGMLRLSGNGGSGRLLARG